MRRLILSLAAVLLLAACATGPDPFGTGDPRLVQRESEPPPTASVDERYNYLVRRFGGSGHLDVHPVYMAQAQRVMDRLRLVVESEYPETKAWAWKTHVLWHVSRIAGNYGKGRLAVPTGFFEQIQPTDDELAFVIGHELAHDLLHVDEMIGILARPSKDADARWRQMEMEADLFGRRMAVKAGYRPDAARVLLTKMDRVIGFDRSNAASARYPDYQTRIRALEQRAG